LTTNIQEVPALTRREAIEAQIAKCNAAIKSIQEERTKLKKQADVQENTIKNWRKQLVALDAQEAAKTPAERLSVSEHAMLRYVERVIGFTREELAERVLPKSARSAIGRVSAETTIPVNDTHRVVIKGGVVVTTLRLEGDEEH